MALCAAVGSGNAIVLQPGVDPANCSGPVLLSSAEYLDFLSALLMFGWDLPAFELAVGGSLLLFSVGFGIGLIINMIRRGRTI